MSAMLPAAVSRMGDLNVPPVGEHARLPLRDILDQRRLSALFQPIIDLGSGDFLGFEGLIRGPADSPLHSPINLFGAAEQQGLQLELEMLSRQTVLEAFARNKLPGRLFLNVSPQAMTHPSFKNGQTLAFMERIGLNPGRVIIEITENQPTFDFAGMRDALLHYHSMGFRIAIDDLGEGFSSLRLWSELRPEFIKVDMHFVQGVDRDPIKRQFLKSIQQIADSCGAQVIAEGVETKAELKVVKDIGIALGQGYFVARPSSIPRWPHPLTSCSSSRLATRRSSRSRPTVACAPRRTSCWPMWSLYIRTCRTTSSSGASTPTLRCAPSLWSRMANRSASSTAISS